MASLVYPCPVAGAYETPEEEWHDLLSDTHPHLQDKSPLPPVEPALQEVAANIAQIDPPSTPWP
jgi:hypothetical protein